MTKKLFTLAVLGLAAWGTCATQGPAVTRFDKYQDAPLSAVKPQGWIKDFLQRQKSGLTGNPQAMSFPYDRPWWSDTLHKPGVPEVFWWPYEQTAYWTDGCIRAGYLLDDDALVALAKPSVDNVLANPQANGRLGTSLFPCQWPMAVFFRALQAQYLETGDEKIIEALHKHFLSYTPDDLANGLRHVINIEGMLWTYGHTGDRKLLEIAEAGYAEHNRVKPGGDLTFDMCLSPDPIYIHGVTHMEQAKLPALLYSFTGKKKYLDAAVNVMEKVDRDHMLPDGVPSSSEDLRSKAPHESHETCDIADYTWALGYLLQATGDARWADKIERAVFNGGPGAITKDFKALQYFSCVNQVIVTGESNHNEMFHGSTWMQYRPYNQVECCAGEINRFMPNYAARMWMRDAKGGVVAAFYGPSVEKVAIPGSKDSLTVTETTDYPFSESIRFTFKTPREVKTPFTFRVPGWCANPSVRVNGEAYKGDLKPGAFVTLNRTFKTGDKIDLRFPMTAKLVQWGEWGVFVERGPVVFAYAVPEKAVRDDKVYGNLSGKKPFGTDFPAWDLRPDGPWNYAIAATPEDFGKKAKVMIVKAKRYPYDLSGARIMIRVPVRRVKGWELVENRYTPRLPDPSLVECEGPTTHLMLVPYGCTTLRLTVFPKAR